jgi:Tfp pilus assembly protein PilE
MPIKSKKAQRGLTLLMKMVVIAIIGILAQVALEEYPVKMAKEMDLKTQIPGANKIFMNKFGHKG